MSKIKWFDAIRAYGLFLVLGYHLFYNSFPGGFLGVDIFFTFSGFLVTAIAIEEVRGNGRFGLLGFYKRRARRIVIPLFFSVLFTLPFMLLISPDFSVGILKQTAAALGFVTNWFQIQTGGSYEAQLLPSVYIHTWSLAIEMQFYLIWGLVCVLLAVLSRRIFRNDDNKRLICFRGLIFIISGTLATFSYLYMNSLFHADRSLDFIYFNTFSRFFPFLIGSFAASIWGIYENQDNPAYTRFGHDRRKLITAGLIFFTLTTAAIIFYISTQYRFFDDFIFNYGFLLTSLLTVALIYGTHGLHCVTPPELEEPRLLRGVADTSYNAYLFHWPFYIVFSALIFQNVVASLVTLVFTFAFSAFVFYKAERVFNPRGRMLDAKYRKTTMAVVQVAVAVSVVAGGSVMIRAPEITSIEASFAANLMISESDDIVNLERSVSAADDDPVSHASLQVDVLHEFMLMLETDTQDPGAAPEPEPDAQDPGAAPEPEPDAQNPGTTPNPEPDAKSPGAAQNLEPVAQDPGTIPNPEPDTMDPGALPDPDPVQSPEPEPEPDPEPPTPAATQSPSLQPAPSQSPAPQPPPESGKSLEITGGVTVIGDSVPLGAQTAMKKLIPDCYVDAAVSRPVSAGRSILADLQKKGELREYVVLALGTNGTNNYEALFTQIIDTIEPGHRIIFVTPFDGRTNENSRILTEIAEWMRGLPAIYDFITIADWNALISTQVNILAGDKVHMGRQDSMELYAEMIADAIRIASQGPEKLQ